MLQFIRDRAQGVIAWFIVFLIVVPFALWGINDYMGGGKEPPVAEVNGTAISKAELQTAYQQQRQRLEQMLGTNFRPEMLDEARMKQAILDGLVEQELVLQAAHEAEMRISSAAIADLIRSVDAFQKDGQFSQQAYERALAAQGLTPPRFEAEVRRDMLTDQWRAGLEQSAFVTRAEADRYQRLQKQTRDFGYALFPVDKFAGQVQVADEEVQKFYDANKGRFVEPERVKVAYLELTADQVAGNIAVAEADARAYYEAHADEFSEPESRRASHILFTAGDTPEADQAARRQAEETLKRIRAGEPFAALAKKLSQDPGSAANGGDLGFFGRGAMVPEFEAKVFSLKKGEVSEPVKTQFGYHIIRLEEVRGGTTPSFEQVRAQLMARMRQEKAQERFYEAAEKLNTLAYEHPESLQAAAEELKLTIKQSDWFSRSGGAGVAANPRIVQAAFSDDVLERGNNSEPVELAPDHLVVLRVEDRRPEAQRPLNEVRPQIVAELRNEKGQEAARAAADKALAAIQGGGDPAAAARSAGGSWQGQKGVTRNEGKIPRAVVDTAFRLARPAQGASAERAALGTGDQAVVVLHGVQEGPALAAETPPQLAGAPVMRAEAAASYQGLVDTLRKQADVELNKSQLQAAPQ